MKYYSLVTTGREADVHIFGDITSWEWLESDVSSYTLSKEIEGMDVDKINVYINSYGGEIGEALAIANKLIGHKATIRTVATGFACSAAANIFMAGNERVMYNASLLMVHNGWTTAAGNAGELRKAANDIEKLTQTSMRLYTGKVNISTEELQKLLDDESWLTPEESLSMGFATEIIGAPESDKATQSVRQAVFNKFAKKSKLEATVNVQGMPEIEKTLAGMQAQVDALAKVAEPPKEPPKEQKENKVMNLMAALLR